MSMFEFPPAYDGCHCECHYSHVDHCAPCCWPPHQPSSPVLRECEKCGEMVPCYGIESPHYVPSVGHYTDLADAIEPYWTCQRG